FINNSKIGCFLKNFFVIQRNKSTDVYQAVFFGTHRHSFSVRQNFATNFFDTSVLLTFLSSFDEIGIFRIPRTVEINRNSVTVRKFFYIFYILERNRLSSGCIAGNGDETKRNFIFWIGLIYFLQFLQIDISFKRMKV